MAACYGLSNVSTMSKAREQLLAVKNGKCYTLSPKLNSLLPTTEAFCKNVERAHYQAVLWCSLQQNSPHDLDVESFRWRRQQNTKTLTPVTVPDHVRYAPDYILNQMKCECTADHPC